MFGRSPLPAAIRFGLECTACVRVQVLQVLSLDWLFTSACRAEVTVLGYASPGEGDKGFVELAWLANDGFGD